MNERETGKSYFTFAKSIFYMFRMFVSIIFINLFRGRGKKMALELRIVLIVISVLVLFYVLNKTANPN